MGVHWLFADYKKLIISVVGEGIYVIIKFKVYTDEYIQSILVQILYLHCFALFLQVVPLNGSRKSRRD
jgi:hypothetical protein